MKERSHFECKFCNCIVTTNIELKENLVLVHEGEKSFECKIFKMRITRHSELNVHIVSVYEGKKPLVQNDRSSTISTDSSLRSSGRNDEVLVTRNFRVQ